jgi:hypothetical protein
MSKIDDLNALRGFKWLVTARNEIQSTMLRLLEEWDEIEDDRTREFCVGIAFSLWRAAFLIHEKETESTFALEARSASPLEDHRDQSGRRAAHARQFLTRVIEANAITFADDDRFRNWTADYYVNNAVYRTLDVFDMQVFSVHKSPWPDHPPLSLREWWNYMFINLEEAIDTRTKGSANSEGD